MNIFQHYRDGIVELLDRLAAEGRIPAGLDYARVTVEPPREAGHGDLSTNAAMVLSKPAAKKPRDLAEMLAEGLRRVEGVTKAVVAGPGFINIDLDVSCWQVGIADILRQGKTYGSSQIGAGRKVNVEYVSANPTGPLHVAHARGAVVGDALASLLEKVGYAVTREYYINDAGAQIDTVARSAHLRYREALGETIGAIPEGLYPGEYLKDLGRALAERDGANWLAVDEAVWLPPMRDFAIDSMMKLIRADLDALGVHQAVFSSERKIVASGGVERALKALEDRGLIYVGTLEPPKGEKPQDWESRPQTLFRSTQFGDDTDRPLKKSNGSWTYFAPDIAYHYDKFQRGFATMIDVWGADHSGYVKRMQAAVRAISDGKGELDVKICQLVNLLRDGQPVKMSKRAGTFVTLREVIDEVGKDVVRFIMLTRRNDATLDFDLAKVIEQSRENPVFYVQYAHARARSVLRNAVTEVPGIDPRPDALAKAPLERLTDPAELALIKLLAGWPRLVEAAAESHEPHRLAFYLYEVAAAFHGLWTKGKDEASLRFLIASDPPVTRARLALVQALAFVIASGLEIMGVTPVEEMR
jgi:arginyl-tRNA synthetase